MEQPLVESIKIISIAGYGRSGSTLLELLLAKKVSAVSVGEVKNLWQRGLLRNELCACGSPTNECPFWSEVLTTAFPNGYNAEKIETLRRRVERHRKLLIHRLLGIRSADYNAARTEYVGILTKLYLAISEVSGGKIIIDSSKDPAHMDLLLEAFPHTRIVHLVRDSRAVAYSFQTPKVRKEVHWKEELMGVNGPLRASLDWMFINFAIEKLTRPSAYYSRVNYETFVEASEDITSEITKSLENGDAYLQDTLIHSVSGNPMRFDGREIVLKRDDRWKTSLRVLDKLIVMAITTPLLLRYGYFKPPGRKLPKEY